MILRNLLKLYENDDIEDSLETEEFQKKYHNTNNMK